MSWADVSTLDAPVWNQRLLLTGAPFFQYPYWAEAFRDLHFSPKYLVWRERTGAAGPAFVSLLCFGLPGFRVGLILRGPVSLSDGCVPAECLAGLATWATRHGIVFLRFSGAQGDLRTQLLQLPGAREEDPFPFYRDQSEELVVELRGDESEMLAAFQPVARQEIKKARGQGFEVRVLESEDAFRAVWPLFTKVAERKGFRYRPLRSYLTILREAAPIGAAQLYVAFLGGRPIEVIFIVRDRVAACFMSGALDVEAAKGTISPSCLLHWHAMRDSFQRGQQLYNLGSRSGIVYQFKRKFRPTIRALPQPVTIVCRRHLYSAWQGLIMRFGVPAWPRVRRLIGRGKE